MDMNTDKRFVELGNYDWPKLPTDHRFRLMFNRLKDEILRSSDAGDPAIKASRLESAATSLLDDIAAPPACGTLMHEMHLTFADWLTQDAPAERVRLVVLPPCDRNDVVKLWAERNHLPCLDAPSRDDLLNAAAPVLPNLEGAGVLVIPDLGQWFLRHRNGLRAVRDLFTSISNTQRRCLIGCNSWAWTYLSSAMGAHLQLPCGVTFQAFDQHRLHSWFSELATGTGVSDFRLSASGTDVFETAQDGTLQSDFFQRLAAHSLGIPWVAWSLWRRSLRERREGEEYDGKQANSAATGPDATGGKTIWIAALADFALPVKDRQTALLALQSLMIHGPLAAGHLAQTLPFTGQTNVIEALQRGGFVRLENGLLTCVPAAYPTIRRELGNAGYSMDVL